MKLTVNRVLTIIIAGFFLAGPTVFCSSKTESIVVKMNSVNIKVNGKVVDANNILYDGVTYVPLKAIVKMLAKELSWDSETNTININDKWFQSNKTEFNRRNPAPIGESQTIQIADWSDEYIAEIAVLECIRGEEAWRLIYEANDYNEKPENDKEYILVKINYKLHSVKDDKKVDLSHIDFDVYSENNVEYDFVSVVTPNPSLDTSLYEGGTHEGYTAYLVKKSGTSPKLVYGQEYDGTGGIWFKLGE